MIPSVALLLSAELVRDGGSLGAWFQGIRGDEYCLMYAVELKGLPSGVTERASYREPVVIDRLSGKTLPASWENARSLLARMSQVTTNADHRFWLGVMVEVAEARGAIPSSIAMTLDKAIRFEPSARRE